MCLNDSAMKETHCSPSARHSRAQWMCQSRRQNLLIYTRSESHLTHYGVPILFCCTDQLLEALKLLIEMIDGVVCISVGDSQFFKKLHVGLIEGRLSC